MAKSVPRYTRLQPRFCQSGGKAPPACKTGPGRAPGETRLEAAFTQPVAPAYSLRSGSPCWPAFFRKPALSCRTPVNEEAALLFRPVWCLIEVKGVFHV